MKSRSPLGSLISSHRTAPAFLQRAAIVAGLSFLFFLATLLMFYMQQRLMYFILSSAFLVVYIFTMIGWVLQKRNVVSIHEHGIVYRKFASRWDEIRSVKADADAGITITKSSGESVNIPKSVSDIGRVALLIRNNLSGG